MAVLFLTVRVKLAILSIEKALSGAVRNGQLPPANKSIRMTAHVWRLRAVIFYCSIATDEKQPSLAESLYDRGSHVRMAPFYFASPSCAPVADMIK